MRTLETYLLQGCTDTRVQMMVHLPTNITLRGLDSVSSMVVIKEVILTMLGVMTANYTPQGII